MKKAVLLPACNEEKSIGEVIEKCRKYCKDALILVVDDGSTDRTAKIALAKGAKVLRHEVNKGKGEAMKTGIRYLKKLGCEAVVVIDADGQYDPKDIPRFFRALERADIVMGCRDFSKVPFRHRIGNFLWRFLFNLLFGTRLKDTNCGFMGFSKKALGKIKNIRGGYIIENSILAEAVEKKLKIEQIPVGVEYREVSGLLRGVRIVLRVAVFILARGISFRLKKLAKLFKNQ